MKILFLTNLLPYPLNNGGNIKTYSTLKALKDGGHSVDLLCFSEDLENDSKNKTKLNEICRDVQMVGHKLTTKNNMSYMLFIAFKSIFSRYSFGVYKYESKQMRQLIRKKIKENKYDIVYFDHLQMFKYYGLFHNNDDIKIVLDQHNCETQIMERTYKNADSILKKLFLLMEYKKLHSFEKIALTIADKVYVLSDQDLDMMENLGVKIKNSSIIPIGVQDTGVIEKKEDTTHKLMLVFIGTLTWNPNNQGIIWFIKNVVPLLKEKNIGFKLLIVGKNPSEELKNLCAGIDNILVTGYVEDISQVYQKADAMIVPLFIGSGQRVKIIESFSKGIPVISTTVGAEGLECENGKDILIADDEFKFVEMITKIQEVSLRKELAKNARNLYEKYYSMEAYSKKYNESFSDIL